MDNLVATKRLFNLFRVLVVIALSIASFWAIALALDTGAINNTPWVRWDSNHYLSIASTGYRAAGCGSYVCGNTGWFPLYPALISLLQRVTGLSGHLAGLLISSTSFVLLVLQVYRLARPTFGLSIFVVALSVLPGSIYLISVFPLSLASVFVLAYVSASRKGRWLIACLFAFFAVAAYPSAVLCFATPLIFFVHDRANGKSGKMFACLLASAFPWMSYFSIQWSIEWLSGVPRAYWLTQQRYGHSIGFGFETLRTSIRYFHVNPIYLQSLVVLFLLFIILLYLGSTGTWKDPVACSLFAYSLLVFLVYQLYGDTISSYRQEALMAPVLLYYSSKLDLPWLLLGVGLLMPLSLEMTRLFLSGVLV